MLDTFVAAQIRSELATGGRRARMQHLRTSKGREEVDIVIELPRRRVVALEVKATSAPTRADARHLAWLRDRIGDRFLTGIILHTGPDPFRLDDRILALPIWSLWQ